MRYIKFYFSSYIKTTILNSIVKKLTVISLSNLYKLFFQRNTVNFPNVVLLSKILITGINISWYCERSKRYFENLYMCSVEFFLVSTWGKHVKNFFHLENILEKLYSKHWETRFLSGLTKSMQILRFVILFVQYRQSNFLFLFLKHGPHIVQIIIHCSVMLCWPWMTPQWKFDDLYMVHTCP